MASPSVGDELPPFRRTTGLEEWNRYAAVADEFAAIHMDDDAGRAAGHDAAFGMGNLQVSYYHNLLRTWLGPSGRVLRLQCRFREPNTKGEQLTCRAVITSVENAGDRYEVTLDLLTVSDRGVTVSTGMAVVATELLSGAPS